MRFLALAPIALLVVVACAREGSGPSGNTPTGGGKAGRCAPSSVVTTASCPARTFPASNKSSARGCKSDADCKNGLQGRCVDSGFREPGSALPVARTNVLAEPPPLPAPTVCTYDQCKANSDCGKDARCACGAGDARNACIALDRCLADADCGADSLCNCGTDGQANHCLLGNCRTDADCPGHTCNAGPSGSFCTTDHDACATRTDCEAKDQYRVCDYERDAKKWACREVPPMPPG